MNINSTRNYLNKRFAGVVAAVLAVSLLPLILLVITTKITNASSEKTIGASDRLRPSASDVDVSDYIADGGSAMIVDNDLNVTLLGGTAICENDRFTSEEWADFLVRTNDVSEYQYDIAYLTGNNGYWLVLRKPIQMSISFGVVFNPEAPGFSKTVILLSLILSVYFIALFVFVIFYSKQTEKEMKERELIKREEEEKRMLLVSEISHDLKTPLASVQGYSELLVSKDVDEQKKLEYAQKIYDNSVRSNNILKSLFVYSKLESAGYILEPERTDICEFTRQIMAEYIPELEKNGFGYDLSVPDKNIPVNIDPILFRRVYDNLIGNSVKYNSAGTKILVSITDINAERSSVDIVIGDDGIGIPKESLDKIFQPFFRGEKNAGNSEGSGLGLAIVHKIINLHCGEIKYTGDENGCSWHIRLPKI